MLRRAHGLIPAVMAGFSLAAAGEAVWAQNGGEKRPTPNPVPAAAPASPATNPAADEEAAFTVLRKLLSDAEGRKSLEPVGAETLLLNYPGKSEAARLLSALEAPSITALTTRLEALGDPLAARLAATIALRRGNDGAIALLNRLATKFPDEPGLGLAAGAIGLDRNREAQSAAFRRALKNLTGFAGQDLTRDLQVCGVGTGLPDGKPETMEALIECLERVRPELVPEFWMRGLEESLSAAVRLDLPQAAQQVEAILEILVRSQPSVRQGAAPAFSLLPALKKLVTAGRRESAARLATALVLRPRGALEQNLYTHIAPAWLAVTPTAEVSGKSEAWLWIQLAAGEEPALLAEALDKVLMAHPGDAQLALSSLLARSLVRPLVSGDLTVLAGLNPASRDLVLTYASMILSPRLLPGALCLEAWERQAGVWFQSGRLAYALNCLDRLEENGAPGAVARTLPLLLASLTDAPFPGSQFSEIAGRMENPGSAESAAAWQQLLHRWSRELPVSLQLPSQLADILRQATGNPLRRESPADLPSALRERVTSVLEAAAAASPQSRDYHQWGGVFRLAVEAASYPQWHPLLTKLMTANSAAVVYGPDADKRDILAKLMTGLAADSLAPSLRLTIHHPSAGPPVLSWTLRGLVTAVPGTPSTSSAPASDPGRKPEAASVLLPWPSLAKPMAEHYRAEFFIAGNNGAETVLAVVDPLVMAGSVSLTKEKLPPAGRLQARVIRRTLPAQSALAGNVTFSGAPVLLDTAVGGEWGKPPPDGREFLGTPVPFTPGTGAWLVSSKGGNLPEGLRLLLLDAQGRPCAEENLAPPPPPAQPQRKPAYSSAISRVRRQEMAAGLAGYWDNPSVQSSGRPCFLALALPREAGMDSWFSRTPDLPALTVQEWAVPGDREPGESALEIVSLWSPAPSGEWEMTFSVPKSKAIWWRGSQAWIASLAENEPARRLVLPLEEGEEIRAACWHGKWVRFLTNPPLLGPETRPKRFRLLTLDSGRPDLSPAIHVLQEYTKPNCFYLAGPELPILLVTLASLPYAILPPDGGFLPVGPDILKQFTEKRLSTSRLLSRDRLLCYSPDPGSAPVLDWSSGVLKLEFLPDHLPFPDHLSSFAPLTSPAGGLVYQPLPEHTYIMPRPVWRLPLRVSECWPLPSGLILAVNEDTAALAVLQPRPPGGNPPKSGP